MPSDIRRGSAQSEDAKPDTATAAADAGPDITVTAQRRDEAIQTVPIAVTALAGGSLDSRRIESGADIELAVPNMTFTRASFDATNYQIRGVGYQVVSTDSDTGVSVHENGAPVIVNRLADADMYDVQRVEVLRGPQGTLFGRNATGGVINLLSNKPTDALSGELTGEYGNYDTRKLKGFVNVPIAPGLLDLRVAGMWLKRDGFQYNAELGDHIDGRNLYSTRATLAFTPSSNFRANLMWEHYHENDDRFGSKFVCAKDAGPTSIGGVAVTNADAQSLLSRGCLQDSIYSPAAQTGTVNTVATLAGRLANEIGVIAGDANAGATQPGALRSIDAAINPFYRVHNDMAQLDMNWDVGTGLTLSSLTTFSRDTMLTKARFEDGSVPFAAGPITPNGVFADPQTGASAYLNIDGDYDNYKATQWTQEMRLQSHFDGPINFSAGGLYLHLKRDNYTYILSNGFTAASALENLLGAGIYIDPNAAPNGQGHNYYLTYQPYTLTSLAAFGEVYWQFADNLRLTAGIRYTDDRKSQPNYPTEVLNPGQGVPAGGVVDQKTTFREPTGRVNLDWQPHLGFTDHTLVYASFSRGYKSGGFNPPNIVSEPASYAPEFVNSFELGTKNTLFGGRLTLNLTGFYYDYTGYQISQVEGLNEQTANVDATIYGLEFESRWQATRHLAFDTNIGLLHTRIDGGSSIDIFNRTQGDPSLTYLKGLSSACVGSTAQVAALIKLINAGTVSPDTLGNACPSAAAPNGAYASSDPAVNPLAALGIVLPTNAGVAKNLKGDRLPNAPNSTMSFGAQYSVDLPHAWKATLYGQFYHQASEYTDIYNDAENKLKAWSNVNMTLTFERRQSQMSIQFYVKNLTNKTPITGVGVDSEVLGISRSVNYLDPRQFGLSITKGFR